MVQRTQTALSHAKGIKRTAVAMALILATVLTSIVYTRPVNAEVFNSKKSVQCMIRIVWFQGCKAVVNPGETGRNTTPSTTPGTSKNYSDESGAGSGGSSAGDSALYPPLDITVSKLDTEVPALPAPVGATGASSQSSAHASVLTPLYSVSDDTASAPFDTPLRTTGEGWHILGIAWYWWLAGIAVVGMGVYGLIRHRRRAPFVLAK